MVVSEQQECQSVCDQRLEQELFKGLIRRRSKFEDRGYSTTQNLRNCKRQHCIH
jgi:hypothetical protein